MSTNNDEQGRAEYRITVRFGDEMLQAGHTAIPNLALNYYAYLGISPAEMMFAVHIWQYWWTEKVPYPSLNAVAEKMDVTRRQVRNYAQSLKAKGYLIVEERFQPGHGQITSEYDFSHLFQSILFMRVVLELIPTRTRAEVADQVRQLFTAGDTATHYAAKNGVIRALEDRFPQVATLVASYQPGRQVTKETAGTPRKDSSEGGRKDFSQAPRKGISSEEYTVEQDEVSSNTATPAKSAPLAGTASKFRKGSHQEFFEQERGETPQAEPAPTATKRGMTHISEVLQAKGIGRPHPAENRRQAANPTRRQAGPPASSPAAAALPTSPDAALPPRALVVVAVPGVGERTRRRRQRTRVTAEEEQAIQVYLGDYAPELGDQAPFQSSVTRVCNLYAASGFTLGGFFGRVEAAHKRTKHAISEGRIRTRTKRFAYFLALLEEECGLREPPPEIAAAARSQAEVRAQQTTVPTEPPPQRRSLAGKYAHLVRGAEDDEVTDDHRQSRPSERLSGPRTGVAPLTGPNG